MLEYDWLLKALAYGLIGCSKHVNLCVCVINGVLRHCTKAGHTRLETKKNKKKKLAVPGPNCPIYPVRLQTFVIGLAKSDS